MIDYNKKYKFVSDGTWFKKGTECIVEDGTALWDYDNFNSGEEIPYERMIANPDRIGGIFVGTRICEYEPAEGREEGEEYEDGEVCSLDEFEIAIIRDSE